LCLPLEERAGRLSGIDPHHARRKRQRNIQQIPPLYALTTMACVFGQFEVHNVAAENDESVKMSNSLKVTQDPAPGTNRLRHFSRCTLAAAMVS
jgi:hypothetical protein